MPYTYWLFTILASGANGRLMGYYCELVSGDRNPLHTKREALGVPYHFLLVTSAALKVLRSVASEVLREGPRT